MKYFSIKQLFFILFFYQTTTVFAQLKRKVLFIGNSYTFVNNLPQIIADAALSVNDTLVFDSHTSGGYRLIQHSVDGITQSKIMAGDWNYVVLQGQSQEPIIGENNFYEGAENLNTLIKQYNPCAVPLLYMTWGRKNGDASNCPKIPVMCTYEGMDTTLKGVYLTIAELHRNEISPVSVVWKYLRNNYPTINLYQEDESHPSAEGSYAAACCFYATIFKKNPAFITYNFGLDSADAAIIRNAARIMVFDSLNLWDYKKPPVADFNFEIGSGLNQVVFNNTSQNYDNYIWNFGDGTTSNLQSPSHSYLSNGTYTVTLSASNCDLQGVKTSTKSQSISFCAHTPTISPETLLLCPNASDTVWTQAANSYQWYNNGIPIPGETKQYLVASRMFVVNYPFPSVLTTNAGCSELSKPTLVESAGWTGFNIIGFNTFGNVLSGDTVCNGDTLKLVAYFMEDHLTQWYKNGVAIPLAISDTITVTNSGAYKVKIIHPMCSNINGFSDSVDYKFVSCNVGVKENNPSLFESIYPNPATDLLTIKFKSNIQKDQIQIYNAIGVLVKVVDVKEYTQINISDFPNGLYFIRLKNNQQQTQKFIKQ